MAPFTSRATGNWSAAGPAGTWEESGVPGNGDTVTIGNGHVVTVDVNTTVGSSPATGGTAAITVTGTTGKLIIAAGITLVARGDIRLADAPFTMNAGAILEFDASAATTPLSQHYVLQTATANYQNNVVVTVTGTAGARCTIRSNAGGGTGSLKMNGSGGYRAFLTFRYTNFTNLGTASVPSIEKGGTTSTFDLQNCVFDTCGTIMSGATGATAQFQLLNVTMKNTVATTYCYQGDNSAAAKTGGTRLISGCVFDKLCTGCWRDYTITDTLFSGATSPISTAGTTPWASFTNNLLVWGGTLEATLAGSITNCYCLANYTAINPHYLQATATPTTVGGCVFQYIGTAGDGDGFQPGAPGTPVTFILENNLAVPNVVAGGNQPGSLFSLIGNANVTVLARHNTWFGGSQACAHVGETYAGHAGLLGEFRDNLCWDTSARTWKLQDVSSTVNDVVSAANCHHNAGYLMLAGSNGKGYQALDLTGGSPGANDVDGVNPQFVDATRNLQSWDASVGGAGTVANALTELKKKNEAGYNPAYQISALVSWVKAGFVPQAGALYAASDNVAPSNGWIGAVMGVAAGPRVSAAAGNWNAGTTWVGGLVPGNGDTAIVNHTVTVTANQTVGTSPVAGVDAITVNATGQLVLSPSVLLTCRGDLTLTNSSLTGGVGSELLFDASASAAPSTTQYRLALEGSAVLAPGLSLLGIG
jgi:hypothetical protein